MLADHGYDNKHVILCSKLWALLISQLSASSFDSHFDIVNAPEPTGRAEKQLLFDAIGQISLSAFSHGTAVDSEKLFAQVVRL